jgi:hypothetical protein
MMICPDEWCQWHIISISVVCSIKCDNISELQICHSCPIMNPKNMLHDTIFICIYGIEELGIFLLSSLKVCQCGFYIMSDYPPILHCNLIAHIFFLKKEDFFSPNLFAMYSRILDTPTL